MVGRKPMGRPLKGSAGGRTAAFSARITPELRARLETEAKAHGCTLSDEIESRLLRSFRMDEEHAEIRAEREQIFKRFGGRKNYAAARVIAEIMRELTAATGKSWSADAWTFAQFETALGYFLERWRPDGPAERPALAAYPADIADKLGVFTAAHLRTKLIFADLPELAASPEAHLREDLGELLGRVPEAEIRELEATHREEN